jgi:transcriptional regulator with XRE-family HTH domain
MRTLGPVRVQQPQVESLASLLGEAVERVKREKGKSQAQVARDAWLDESYLSRLLSGERENPSRDVLILLGSWGLELAVEDVDELLDAADYKALVPKSNLR